MIDSLVDPTVYNEFPLNKEMLLWVTVTGESGNIYYIVSDKLRREYFLWKGNKQTAKKSTNPTDLYKYVK